MTARRSFKWVFATALLVSSLSRIASAAPVTSIVVYGDSLSDNGNLFSATGQPPAPYFAGRASDGPVTVELLAGSLGVPLLDFAWFGATTGIGNSVDGGTPTSSGFLSLPGMQTQFLASQPFLGPHIENGLFVVWGGANDVVSPSPFDTTPQDIIARAVGNMLGIVSALQGLGVQLILVPGLPDLGLSPRVAAFGPAAVAQATAFTDAFNLALTAGLPSDVLFFDTAAVLRSIVANPAAFGLSNVTTPCFNGVTVCADPSQYLFWDDVHTTTAANAVFANEMEKLLPVPEPAMLALTGIGLAAAGCRFGIGGEPNQPPIRACGRMQCPFSSGVRSRMSSQAPVPRRFDDRLVLVSAGGLAVAVLVAHAITSYGGFVEDDAFISLRYSKRFLQGHGLTWTDGEPVEGYTNFLWVLLIAAVGAFSRTDLINVARVVGVVLTSTAIVAVIASEAPRRWRCVLLTLAPAVALAVSGPVAAASLAGLEQPLLAALVTVGAVLVFSLLDVDQPPEWRLWLVSLTWALAALTRPDGVLFTFAGALGWVLARGLSKSALLSACRFVLLPIVAVFLHLCFRQFYYHDWVPNTYYAKVAYSYDRVVQGARYIILNWRPFVPFLLLVPIALFAAVIDRQRRRRLVFVSIPLLTYTAFVVAAGGDTMPHGRHVVALLFLLALVGNQSLHWLANQGQFGARAAQALAVGVIAVAIIAEVQNPRRSRLDGEPWVWRGRPLGLFLSRAFGERDPLFAVDAAGSTPYYAEIDSLDMLGLNDRYLALHRPTNFGRGPFGHELGDAAYVLRRKPDLVMFHVAPGRARPVWRAGIDLVKSPEFARHYQLVTFETGDPTGERALLWVRREDSRVGISRTPARITVPGFLVVGGRFGPFAGLDDTGQLAVLMPPESTARLEALPIASGSWRITVRSSTPVTLTITAPALPEKQGDSGSAFEVPATADNRPTEVTIQVRARNTAASVHAIELERVR